MKATEPNLDGPHPPPRPHSPSKAGRVIATVGAVVCIVFGVLYLAILYLGRHAEPFVRARIINTLEDRLHATVKLDQVNVSPTAGGVQVGGAGLVILASSGKPLLSARSFKFSTGLRDVFSKKSALVKVFVQGLDIDIPAGEERQQVYKPLRGWGKANPTQGFFSIVEVVATDATLSIDRLDPNKPPLTFQISKLRFSQSMPGAAFVYDANLINPKPTGEIHATGRFGPWNAQVPRQSPIEGNYTFSNADLSTITGIRGHLDAAGDISGDLGDITTDGATHTPDFGIDPGTTPVTLDTHYHAIVDGTSGDVILQPVTGRFRNTDIVATGRVVRVPEVQGHDIELDTQVRGRVEDVLALISKGKSPLLRASLSERGRLHIPPGKQRVITRIQVSGGTATLSSAVWTDPDTQGKVDSLSMRAQGKAEELKHDKDDGQRAAVIASSIKTSFSLNHGALQLTGLTYALPGASIQMDGTFDIPADTLDFHGHVRTEASPSQMITGWKSILLKPFDPLFKRNGAGMQLPIELTGSPSKPHAGLDMKHHADAAAPAAKP